MKDNTTLPETSTLNRGTGLFTHELKCWPRFFQRVASGEKTHETRKDDRAYEVGDMLYLREWNPETSEYTGATIMRQISHVLRHTDHAGVAEGYVVLSLGVRYV